LLRVVLLTCLLLTAATAADAQTSPVRIRFEVDGKELRKPVRIFIAPHYDAFKPPIVEPPVKDGSFVFPPELKGLKFEEVSVRVVCGKYTVEFTEVEVEKFTGQMVFGVDYRPFDPEFLKFRTAAEKKRLAVLHYVRFIPESGTPTWMTVGTER
jgi:hypothetical protein